MVVRARLGDSPSWITRCVLTTWVGLPVVCLVWVGGFLAVWQVTGDPDPPPVALRPVVTVLHLAVLAALARGYVARRPLDEVERGYYRLALWVIGIFGLVTSWLVGLAVALALLGHSWFVDDRVTRVRGTVPVTPEHRSWLERGGDGDTGTGR